MAGAGNTRELTPVEIRAIKEMRGKNQSMTAIAKALEMSPKTLRKRLKENPQITEELKIVEEDRVARVAALAQDSLELLLTKHRYTEIKEVRKRTARIKHHPVMDVDDEGVEVQRVNKNGKLMFVEEHLTDELGYPLYDLVVEERTSTRKFMMPNAMLVRFAKINTDPSNYQAENNAEVNIVNRPEAKVNVIWRGTPGAAQVDKERQDGASRD